MRHSNNVPAPWPRAQRRDFAAFLQVNLRYAVPTPGMLSLSGACRAGCAVHRSQRPWWDPPIPSGEHDAAALLEARLHTSQGLQQGHTVPDPATGLQSLLRVILHVRPVRLIAVVGHCCERHLHAGWESTGWTSLTAFHHRNQHSQGGSCRRSSKSCLTPGGLAHLRRKRP
jgi:hypothetical protein